MNANSDREYIDSKVGEVRTAVDDLRLSSGERVAALHGRFDSVDAQFRAIGDQFKAVSDQFRAVGEQFKALDVKIESTVEAAKAEIIKWIAGLLIAMVALFVGAVGTLVNLLSHPQPLPTISTPAVVIQLSPQGAVVLPAAPAVGKP